MNGADGEGNTALIGACFGGHLEIVEWLLLNQADVNQKNGIGCSPLWIAAGYGHEAIVQYLLQQVQDYSMQEYWNFVTQRNSSGDTPFLAAASRGHVSICRVLLQEMIRKGGDSKSEGIRYAYQMLCLKNNSGDTALAIAVGNGADGALLDLLLGSEEEYWNAIVLTNETKDSGSASSSSTESLPMRPLHTTSNKGLTPLLIACERCHTSIIKQLIQRGATSTPDSKGRSPLAVAAFCGLLEVVEYLLKDEHGSNMGRMLLNEVDEQHCTPLWLAARTGNGKMVKILLEAGADPSIENEEGLTPEAVGEKFGKESVKKAFEDFRRIEILEEEAS